MKCYNVLILFTFVAVESRLINFEKCSSSSSLDLSIEETDVCTIENVEISPCGDDEDPCRLKNEENVTVSITFNANFHDKLRARAFWLSGHRFARIPEVNADACLSTVCPNQRGKNQTYSVQVPLRQHDYFTSMNHIRWVLFASSLPKYLCCVEFHVEVYN